MMRRNIALIPAAGVGARFGAGKPKQYVEINGKTVLQHTIEIFEQHSRIDLIAVILSPEDSVFQTKRYAMVCPFYWSKVWPRRKTIFWFMMPHAVACLLKR